MDTYADDLADLLDKLDVHDAILVGHSTGGGEAARYIGRHGTERINAAVLLGAVHRSGALAICVAFNPKIDPGRPGRGTYLIALSAFLSFCAIELVEWRSPRVPTDPIGVIEALRLKVED
jgi:pimeloyl-ACP methyl ester carboxylesterase